MYQMMSLPLYSGTLGEYNSWRDLGQELERLGCDGIEGVWGGRGSAKGFACRAYSWVPPDFLPGLAGLLSR